MLFFFFQKLMSFLNARKSNSSCKEQMRVPAPSCPFNPCRGQPMGPGPSLGWTRHACAPLAPQAEPRDPEWGFVTVLAKHGSESDGGEHVWVLWCLLSYAEVWGAQG